MPETGPSDPADEPATRSPASGIGARAAATVGSFLDYLDARLRLLGLEAREAKGAVIRRVIAAAIGAFFLLIAYLALLAGGIALAADLSDKPWYWMALAAGGGHVLVGALCLLYAKRQLEDSPFRDSRKEFEKDRKWLNSMRPPKS